MFVNNFIESGMVDAFFMLLSPLFLIIIIVAAIALKNRSRMKADAAAMAAAQKARAERAKAAYPPPPRVRPAYVPPVQQAYDVSSSMPAPAETASSEGLPSGEGMSSDAVSSESAVSVQRPRPDDAPAEAAALKLDLGRGALLNAFVLSEALGSPKAARAKNPGR